MATPKTFNDETLLRTALYNLLENDTELFNAIVSATLNASEWLAGSWTPIYAAANQFNLPGDHLTAYVPMRRVRAHLDTGYVYSHVIETSFSAVTGNTTITLADDVLNNSLDEVALGIITPGDKSSLPDEKPKILAPIYLNNWQTNPNEYTVLRQDIYSSESFTKDSFYHYVFRSAYTSIMYQAIGPMPFSGYNLQLNFAYRMTTTDTSNFVAWALDYKSISDGEGGAGPAEIQNYSTWNGLIDGNAGKNEYPNAANVMNVVSGTDIVIPATAYSAGDVLKLAFIRWSPGGHAGNAKVLDSIFLLPVLP